jgi:hypothetical protein
VAENKHRELSLGNSNIITRFGRWIINLSTNVSIIAGCINKSLLFMSDLVRLGKTCKKNAIEKQKKYEMCFHPVYGFYECVAFLELTDYSI